MNPMINHFIVISLRCGVASALLSVVSAFAAEPTYRDIEYARVGDVSLKLDLRGRTPCRIDCLSECQFDKVRQVAPSEKL